MTREEVCVNGYQVIKNTGCAKTKLFDALESATMGDYAAAQELIKDASELICKAQSFQSAFEEKIEKIESEKLEFVVEHGNDHLQTTLILRDLVSDLTIPGLYNKQQLKAMYKRYH